MIGAGTLLGGYHHREYPKLGWTCLMTNGTHWPEPASIDPTLTRDPTEPTTP